MRTERFGGLDRFRVAAALMVIAIHTSPLASFSAAADFVLTRVAARLAVPFFLMTTGYFILPGYVYGSGGGRLLKALKKTGLLYLFAAAIYLPLGVYAGHYKGLTPLSALKMLVFDGTFYHLWYLPAAMLGMAVIAIAAKKLKPRGLAVMTSLLYLVGLLGDSYWGLVKYIPFISDIYGGIFAISTYTRNGLFYAPIFLLLGAMAAKTEISHPPIALALSLGAMTAEGLALRALGLQRHDSMYLLLPLCSYALFMTLLKCKAPSSERLRAGAAVIYIIHPWMIVTVRFGAKLLSADRLFIENSLIHYAAVCALSATAAYLWTRLMPEKQKKCRAWAEVDLSALAHNVKALSERLPQGCALMPAVKADAYGHGAVAVSRALNRLGCRSFCVATATEGAELRRGGVKGEILILGCTPLSQIDMVRRYRLTQTAADADYAAELNSYGKKIEAHLAVDTGMNRLGERAENSERILSVFKMKNLKITGIFTHLAAADVKNDGAAKFTAAQAQRFFELCGWLKEQGYEPKKHILNSGGIVNYPELGGDYARPGIALYGVMSTAAGTDGCELNLRPVLSVKSEIVLIKNVKQGENIGYGLCVKAQRDMRLAVVPIGYADGLPRSLSCGRGKLLIRGEYAPIVGRVCMDQVTVDITDIEGACVGDAATVIGRSGDRQLRACDLAEDAGTISNEILCRLGKRLPRVI